MSVLMKKAAAKIFVWIQLEAPIVHVQILSSVSLQTNAIVLVCNSVGFGWVPGSVEDLREGGRGQRVRPLLDT